MTELSTTEGKRLWAEGKLPGIMPPADAPPARGPNDRTLEFATLGNVERDTHHESRSLPRFWRTPDGKPLAPAYSPDGKPRFDSKKERDEAITRHNGEVEGYEITYGEVPLPDGEGE